jgi:hypothetical protein
MKNLHIIPTDKPSSLYYKGDNYKLANSTMAIDWYISSAGYEPTNIYITNDEQPKHNDYYTTDGKKIHYCNTLNPTRNNHYKKVILTTDPDLIADGVQAIDDEFLEWFVKNPSCESIEVEDEGCQKWINPEELKPTKHKYIWISVYKIIIPQEEPKQEAQGYICPQTKKQCDDECCVSAEDCHIEQSIGVISDCEPDEEPCDNCDYCNNDICCCIIRTQETLEEADELVDLCNKINFVNPRERVAYYNGLKNGTKWQQDQDKNKYSEEEVLVLLLNCRGENPIDIEYWFEQFKKK